MAATGLAAAAGSAGVLVGGRAPSRTPTPTRSSPEWCWAPTTSTSAPGRTATRRRSSWPRTSPGQPMTVTYADLEKAPAVLLAGFEPEEESPIVFLRLRKAARKNGAAGDRRSRRSPPAALTKMRGRLIATAPGGEAAALDGLADDDAAEAARRGHPGRRAAGRHRPERSRRQADWRRRPAPGSAGFRGAPASAARWRPARCPNLLPGGRPVADASAREQTAAAWNVADLPTAAGPRHRRHSGRGAAR